MSRNIQIKHFDWKFKATLLRNVAGVVSSCATICSECVKVRTIPRGFGHAIYDHVSFQGRDL